MPGGRSRTRSSDGRANNGGARQGTPGTPYQNRTDLQTQKPTAVPNQTYGQAGAQLAAQKAVPMAGAAAGVPPQQPGAGGPMGPEPPPPPDLYRPTEAPGEHVMTGLPTGPGAGPEALPINSARRNDPLGIQIRALYQKYPSSELAALLADL